MDDQTLHHFMQDLFPIVVTPIMLVLMAWILGGIIGAFKHRAQLKAQTDLYNKMLEKFGTAREFMDYIQSDAGKVFFERLAVEPATPLTGIINSIKIGVILTLLGLGIFLTSGVIGTTDSQNIMFIVSIIVAAVGIGFLVSSAISYRLSKTWGLITFGNQATKSEESKVSSSQI